MKSNLQILWITTLTALFAFSLTSCGSSGGGGHSSGTTEPLDTISVTKLNSIPELIHLGPVLKLANGNIILGGATSTNAVLYRSTDNGSTWTKVCDLFQGSFGDPVMGITQLPSGRIFAIVNRSNELFYSDDAITCQSSGDVGFEIQGRGAKLLSIDNRLYILSGTSLYYSDDEGIIWNVISNVINNYSSMFNITSTKYIVAGCCSGGPSEAGISIASHNNLSFSNNLLGLTVLQERPKVLIEKDNMDLLVIGGRLKTWISNDNNTFQYVGQGTNDEIFVHSGLKSSGLIFLSTSSLTQGAKFYLSNNDGDSFQESNVTGYIFDQIIKTDETTLLGFEMLSYDGNHPTDIYQIKLNVQ